jgi:hypothetical protein
MKVVKMSISMDPELGERARLAAERSGQPLSQWIAVAVDSRLRAESLRAFIAEYEAEEGAFTAKELTAARRRLGLPASGVTPA